MDKTLRAVISGSRLFNTVFGLPRNAEHMTRSLGTFQSGSPPGQATISTVRYALKQFSKFVKAINYQIGSFAQ
jgi:hypothetical protein